MNDKLDHVGVKVSNIEDLLRVFTNSGIDASPVKVNNETGLKTVFLHLDNCKIELLEVIHEKSTMANDRLGLHHIAFQCTQIEEVYAKMKNDQNYSMLGGIKKGANNKKIFFFKINCAKDITFQYTET